MFSKKSAILCAAAAAFVVPAVFATSAKAATNWDAFAIRNGTDVNTTAPIVTENGSNGVSVSIWIGSQKAGYGTNVFNGQPLSSVLAVNYTRDDIASTTTSPYVNIWVTDGTNYAIIAPHSYTVGGASPDFGGLPSDIPGNNVDGLALQSLGFSVYENSAGTDYNWIFDGGVRPNGSGVLVDSNTGSSVITLADIGNLTVEDPNAVAGSGWTGSSGAPKAGDGFVIMFGEPQLDVDGNAVPYVLSNVSVVPEPASLALLGLGAVALLTKRRRKA